MRDGNIVLETGRLILREFHSEDVDALAKVLSDAETMRYYSGPFDRAGVKEWIERNQRRYARDEHGLWAMVLKANGELVGDCGLVKQELEGEPLTEIGYHVRRDLWRRGYATEAACACRDYGFSQLKAERLISLIRPGNQASRKVAEKTGLSVWKEIMWHGSSHLVYLIRRNA